MKKEIDVIMDAISNIEGMLEKRILDIRDQQSWIEDTDLVITPEYLRNRLASCRSAHNHIIQAKTQLSRLYNDF